MLGRPQGVFRTIVSRADSITKMTRPQLSAFVPGNLTPRGRYVLIARLPDPTGNEPWDVIDAFDTPIEGLRGCSHCHDFIWNLLFRHPNPGAEADRRIRLLDSWLERPLVWFDETSESFHFEPDLFDSPVPLESMPEA